ncbi:MAG: hypothetical protein ABS36_04980 [Acidobacteria bacterium SCN 69-37]|nr:MAG: hypothetical protein ABS36_04980 [Acidobacteria bacterium SCN 69-37]
MISVLAAVMSVVALGSAHPGHGSTLLTGTLVSVSKDDVRIEVRDLASMSTRTVRVLVNSDTKYRLGKERVDISQGHVGARVEVLVDYEEGATGETTYLAREFKLTKAKDKR